jgi:hypothetical protein
MIGALRRVAGVGHCMVFTFEGERSARCLLDIGNIRAERISELPIPNIFIWPIPIAT